MSEKKKAQEALARSLSGLRPNPYLAQRVIAQAKGEKTKMKKKFPAAVCLALALFLATMGTAYALITSQTAEFFGAHWNQEMEEWLNEGKVAKVGESVELDGVECVLDEVVYRGRGLFGVGTLRARDEKDVLTALDQAEDGNYFTQHEEGKALLAKARETGGRLLTAEVLPDKIGVDGGEMMTISSIGYYDLRNPDGSVTFSFEATDGYALEEGTEYRLQLCLTLYSADTDGTGGEDTLRRAAWTVEFAPEYISEPTAAPQAQESPRAVQKGGYALLLPEAYRQNGTMPVYRAFASDFTRLLQPEWLNSSGVAKKEGKDWYIFNDHAQMGLSPESVWYSECTGELYDGNEIYREESPSLKPDWLPRPALSMYIFTLASEAYHGSKALPQGISLEKQALSLVTLEEAKAQAEALLEKLGLGNYQCACALDLDESRIRALGEAHNQFWYERKEGTTNLPRPDFTAAKAEDEGYFLLYAPLGVDRAGEGRFQAVFFVSARGIVYANITGAYTQGEIAYTPDSLVPPEQILDSLYTEAARSRYPGEVVSIQRVALSYTAVRAENKRDGMALIPIWQVLYQDKDAAEQEYTCWAEFSALDGTLIDAIFR